jgi:DNA primase
MSTIPSEKIDQVRNASDVVEIISDYLSLRPSGKNLFGLCPFHHEKTPSFSVNPELQIFRCFGCGAGGNVFTFIMRIEKLTFPESVIFLAKKAGIGIVEDETQIENLQEKEALYYANKLAADFFKHTLLEQAKSEQARNYLAKRGIDRSMIDRYDIGYAPDQWDGLLKWANQKSLSKDVLQKAGLIIHKEETDSYYDRFRGRITFAIHNAGGQVVAFGARRIVDDKTPKYINSPETQVYQKRQTLYGLYWARDAIRKQNHVVIVEGYTDLTSLGKVGIEQVVATSGTSLTEDHARLMRRYTTLAILLYDSDSAGSAAALRGADILLENGFEIKIATMPVGEDPDEFAREHGAKAVETLLNNAKSLLDFKVERLRSPELSQNSLQRSQATRELLATVARIHDPIQRSFVVQDLAVRLHVDEKVLWQEMPKKSLIHKRVFDKDNQNKIHDPYLKSGRGQVEMRLIKVIMFNPQLAVPIMSVINFQQVHHPEIRQIFQRIEHELVDFGTLSTQRYLTTIQTPELAEHLLEKVKQTEEVTKRSAIDDIIELYNIDLKNEIKSLREKLKKQPEQSSEIKNQINNLKKKQTILLSRETLNEKALFGS